ncbi:MAG: hypothetical protein NDF54_01225 [archaeon GB-1867-035]|mgnify:CR=1 FL=1|nr:hypothetical protein [Candidatus Culexmicrobium profundum]
MKCPHCGAEFNVPSGVTTAVCPYCGTTINLKTKEIEAEHYAFPIIYDTNKAYEKLKSIVSRQFGAPADLSKASNLTFRQLHYLPLYIFFIEGRALCKEVEVIETESVAIPALTMLPLEIPAKYRFPVRGRMYFKPSLVEAGKYYTPTMSREEAEKIAKMKIYYRLLGEVKLACPGSPIEIDCKYKGLVHYPIWELEYSYSNERFRGIIDAVCGEVFYAEYPMSTFHRTLALGLAAGMIIGGLIVGIGVGLFLKSIATSAIGGLIAGIVGAIPPLTKSAFRKQVYRPKLHAKTSKVKVPSSIVNSGIDILSQI